VVHSGWTYTLHPAAGQASPNQVAGHGGDVLGGRLRRLPTPVVDAGLAVALAVGITIAIGVSPGPGRRPDVLAYGLGLTIAALVLARRRWPLAVLLASVAALQAYYFLDYPGIFPAVPLSVALATAWAAGHQRWVLLVARGVPEVSSSRRPLVFMDQSTEDVTGRS
jgi:hypothetical protein